MTSPPEASSQAQAFPDVWYARVCAVIGTAVALSLPMVRIGTGLESRPLLEEPWLRLMYCAGLVNVLFWTLRSFGFGSVQFVRLGWSISFWWHALPVVLSIAFAPLAAASVVLLPLSVLSVVACLCLSLLALRSLSNQQRAGGVA